MKKLFLFNLLIFINVGIGNANNLSITNVTATTTGVSFNIAWDNSWNISSLNYDAVWLFIKTQDCGGAKTWDHRNVSSLGNTVAGGILQINVASDNAGVFIRRSSAGGGNISTSAVTLTFQTAFPSVSTVNFEVIGVEMVYIPQEQFYVGDNSTNTPGSYVFASGASPGARLITSEGAMAAGFLNNPSTSFVDHAAIPAAFPKGFSAFYIMKYEITQNQYTDFLNLLTHTQQTNRALSTDVVGKGALVAASGTIRNSIEVSTASSGNPVAPAVFGNDLSGNDVVNESNDGGNIACNYLSWDDLRAYLDWAALRPMTELEYEKACRGPETPVLGGYPWGNTSLLPTGALTNSGQSTEVPTATGIGLCNYNTGSAGPLRVGFAATAGSGRTQSGSSYYGVMELAGNVWEQTFTVGGSFPTPGYHIITSPLFAGSLGNGSLTANGEADAPNWGSIGDATNSIVRGGGYGSNTTQTFISDRANHLTVPKPNVARLNSAGGRGVRQN